MCLGVLANLSLEGVEDFSPVKADCVFYISFILYYILLAKRNVSRNAVKQGDNDSTIALTRDGVTATVTLAFLSLTKLITN